MTEQQKFQKAERRGQDAAWSGVKVNPYKSRQHRLHWESGFKVGVANADEFERKCQSDPTYILQFRHW
jgi:hypothetical protein